MKKRLIAYHLPQFHEIKENNEWWGDGYTEWTALKNWNSYFKGHSLRKPFGELGYYDLSEPKILEKQYEVASSYGVEGFCFWTYWFGAGERLLEKPLEHLLLPDSKVKYCFAWANHSWFDKSNWRLLKEQKYLGGEDYELFYNTNKAHFNNSNYIKKDNKLVLSIFRPQDIPDLQVFMEILNTKAKDDGYNGFYFISDQYQKEITNKKIFDAYMNSNALFNNRNLFQKIVEKLVRKYSWTFLGPVRYSYPKMMAHLFEKNKENVKFIPSIFPGWDTTPRHKKQGVVFEDFNQDTFFEHVQHVFSLKTTNEFIFIKSWNEWAEGNTLEPDNIFNSDLLKIVKHFNQDET